MRTLLSRLAVVGCLTVLLAGSAPTVAGAQSPFAPLPQAAPDTTATETTATTVGTTADNGGLERWQEILIFLAGLALLAGIGFAIVGDARRTAPVTDDDDGGHRPSGPGARKAKSKAKARKKGRAQRQARKHNR